MNESGNTLQGIHDIVAPALPAADLTLLWPAVSGFLLILLMAYALGRRRGRKLRLQRKLQCLQQSAATLPRGELYRQLRDLICQGLRLDSLQQLTSLPGTPAQQAQWRHLRAELYALAYRPGARSADLAGLLQGIAQMLREARP